MTEEQGEDHGQEYKNIVQGNWKQLFGKIMEEWGKLTADDLKRSEWSGEYLLVSCRSITG